MTFAYLGAPRTTRQGRAMSLLGAIGAIAALRGIGFVGMIGGVHAPILLLLPYIALIAACVLGYLSISRAVIIEPPAFITEAVGKLIERIARRAGTPRGADVMMAGTLSRYFGMRFLMAVSPCSPACSR